jgi:hypothetical protein
VYRSRLLALAALACVAAALTVPARAQKADKPDKEKPPAPAPETTVVVADSLAKALEMAPDAHLFTPDGYRSLQEKLARLSLLERPAVQSPTKLVLKGKVDGDVVRLTAQYEFQTDKPGTLVRLGGSPAQATAASLDGKTPLLIASRNGSKTDDGFSIQIDRASDEDKPPQLTLDLMLPLLTQPRTPPDQRGKNTGPNAAARGGELGFSINLPRAPITKIEIELPGGCRDVRANGKALSGTSLKGNQVSLWAGLTDRFSLDWQPAATAAAAAVLTADGAVSVRLDKKQTVTTAGLKLGVVSGQTKTWRLLAPPGAKLSFAATDKERVERTETEQKGQDGASLHTIHLKQASAEPLAVTVTSTRPAAKPGGNRVNVGPFNVVGAVQQQGTVLVSSTVSEWHVEAPGGDLTRRAPTSDELLADPTLAAAFSYGTLGGGDRQSGLPWLELEVESVSGQLKAKPTYVLELVPGEMDEGPHWQLQATLTVTPRRAGIDRFTVSLPDGCELDDRTVVLPDRVRSYTGDSRTRPIEFRLNNADSETAAPVTVKFEANYPPLAAGVQQASLNLPKLHSMLEQGAAVTLRVRRDAGVELLPAEKTPGLDLRHQTVHELAYTSDRRAPDRVLAQWRPYRPITRVDSLVDLTLHNGLGLVRHELRYQLPAGAPPRLRLRLPDEAASFSVTRGGQAAAPVGGVATVSLTPGADAVVVEYEFAVAEPNGPIAVPLARPEGDCRGETRVRVWSESGALPVPPRERDWVEQNLEAVPGRDRLPVLVLRSARLDGALTLRTSAARDGASRPLIERALVGVVVGGDGELSYHVRYRLGHLSGRQVDFELPAPASASALVCKLDGIPVNYERLPADANKADRLVRLRLDPQLIKRPSVLELRYRVDAAHVSQTTVTKILTPPHAVGETGYPTRWSIVTPDSWVVVGPEPGPGSPVSWSLRRWPYVPRAAASAADLEAWFSGAEAPADAGAAPSLAPWREADEPLRLTHVPQRWWLIGCSLIVVVLGLVLTRMILSGRPRRTALAWVVIGLLVLGGLVLTVLMPALAAQAAYGCQPGLLVLALLVLAQWLLHERSRRKVIFLPSFSRPKQGSSLSRKEGARPHGEPSTVDAPRRGSSLGQRT